MEKEIKAIKLRFSGEPEFVMYLSSKMDGYYELRHYLSVELLRACVQDGQAIEMLKADFETMLRYGLKKVEEDGGLR